MVPGSMMESGLSQRNKRRIRNDSYPKQVMVAIGKVAQVAGIASNLISMDMEYGYE